MQLQTNFSTGVEYKGDNQTILMSVKEAQGYKSDKWGTYLQIKKAGKKLVNAKGKGIFLRTFADDRKINEQGKVERVTKPISFVVFNMDLTEEVK